MTDFEERNQNPKPGGEFYVALMDVQAAEGRIDRPIFRCGVNVIGFFLIVLINYWYCTVQ